MDSHNLQKGNRVELETVGPDAITIYVSRDEDAAEARPTTDLVISYPLPAEENIAANTTGAYLLGYDVIRIETGGSGSSIPVQDREEIRNSMRRLVGMEIIEEDASHIEIQFLLDAASLSPARILKRMSSIAVGMCEDVSRGLVSGDRSDLQTIPNRDVEVNRQYFLLVRLIRSSLADRRLAGAFNLGSIDILDYRVAATLLENAGDFVVELAGLVAGSSLSTPQSQAIFEAVQSFEKMASLSIDAFTAPDRLLAIEAISQHKRIQEQLAGLRSLQAATPKNAGMMPRQTEQRADSAKDIDDHIPVDFLDVIHMYEKIARSWADVADLVKPIYNNDDNAQNNRTRD